MYILNITNRSLGQQDVITMKNQSKFYFVAILFTLLSPTITAFASNTNPVYGVDMWHKTSPSYKVETYYPEHITYKADGGGNNIYTIGVYGRLHRDNPITHIEIHYSASVYIKQDTFYNGRFVGRTYYWDYPETGLFSLSESLSVFTGPQRTYEWSIGASDGVASMTQTVSQETVEVRTVSGTFTHGSYKLRKFAEIEMDDEAADQGSSGYVTLIINNLLAKQWAQGKLFTDRSITHYKHIDKVVFRIRYHLNNYSGGKDSTRTFFLGDGDLEGNQNTNPIPAIKFIPGDANLAIK